jgi:hypothetical protein
MQDAPQCYSSDLSSPPHTSALPFHEFFSELLGQVAGAAEKLQQPAKFSQKHLYTAFKTALYTAPNNSFVPPLLMKLSGPFSYQPPSPPSFLPPPFINRVPSFSIIGAASSLYSTIAHKERKPPHATSVAVMKR